MIVDASVWASYFIPSDKFHTQTVAWLESLGPNDTLIAPMLLLPEVAGAVTRRTQNAVLGREITQQILAWPSLQLAPLGEALILLASDVAVTLSIKGADAIYIATAQMEGAPLITWDAEQRERGSAIVSTHSPANLL